MLLKTSIKILLFSLFISAWINSSEGNYDDLSTQDLNNYMQDVIAEYQVALRKSAFENSPRRKRRSLDGDLSPENGTKSKRTLSYFLNISYFCGELQLNLILTSDLNLNILT